VKTDYNKLFHPTHPDNNDKFISLYNEAMVNTNCQHHHTDIKRLRFFSLFQLVKYSIGKFKNYNFAECGCFKGQSTWGISKILQSFNFKNRFTVFDSFQGLSDIEKEDENNVGKHKKGQYKSDFENVKDNLKVFDFVKLYEGWIPDRFKEVEDLKFQFVHIDVDLYKPTLASLEFFYPRLINGGVIVCDDYNFTDFPGAKRAWDEYFKSKKVELMYEVPLGSKFLIK
jgi:hypothetical protein